MEEKKLFSGQPESLSRKVVHGGAWIFSLRVAERLLGLIRLIVVARLLSPGDFGLLGIASLITGILAIFIESGFDSALIQKKDNVEQYLDTAWTVQILRGLFLFFIIYAAAPPAAVFFKEPRSIIIIRVFALTQLIDGFRNIGVIYFQKEMDFSKQFALSFLPELIALAATIAAAFILRNVWALVIGAIVCSVFIVIFSYRFHPYRPKLEWNIPKIRNLMSFGKWVIGYGIIGFLIIQGDDILVGKVLGVAALGLYQMAYRISNLPATQVTHVIGQVTFPAYSKLQDDIPRLREAYLRVLQVSTFLSFPIAGLIYILSPLFTKIFLGPKWESMIPAMQVLCVFGLIRSYAATTGPVFNAVGKPRILTQLSFIQLIFLALIIYPLTVRWGIAGTAMATVIPNLLIAVLASIKIVNIIRCDITKFLGFIIFPFLLTGIMVVIGIILLRYCRYSDIAVFGLVLAAGAGSYLGMALLMGKRWGYDIFSILNNIKRY
ncbi:MAG: lipopolysaccharide biosynthesis protein [Candidatus Omnitrophica bacterium]|nr:lipopolysaccharide biosynthesis protein [Candidatus Omnitrophota bacterium]MBU4477594.1 lipopolysaccharide biosynthesis protein [Candidatus Omnitrophota bacterium]MCG2702801.1 lipopolysaccharide biosynthesis protein [Candidatus Omnitrophota bacterium]